jgi:hypothetical protein
MDGMVSKFLGIQNQIQILHWQTRSYARHMAYGDLYEEITDLVDDFIEIYTAKYDRIKVDENGDGIVVYNTDSPALVDWLESVIGFLCSELPSGLNPEQDTDLLNIRDEILARVNKLRYKLTLK